MKKTVRILCLVALLGLVAAPALHAHGEHGVDVGLAVEPDVAAPGDTVTVTGPVINTGTRKERIWLHLIVTVDGARFSVASRGMNLAAGQESTLSIPFTVPSGGPEGTYVFTLRAYIPHRPLVLDEASADLTVMELAP